MSKIKEIIKVGSVGEGISYEPVAIDSYEGVCKEKALSHSFLMDSFRKIMGRTLTVIDASIQEKQQNKAIKDLIRHIFSDEMEFAAQMVYDQDEMSKMAEESLDALNMSDEELVANSVTIEEALGVK